MPIVVDNNFSRDFYVMRSERLSAIHGNFASIQTELAAPAEIATWQLIVMTNTLNFGRF